MEERSSISAEREVFLANLGDIELDEIQGDVNVNITLKADVVSSYSERHTAVDGKVVIKDLRSVCEKYFNDKYDKLVNALVLNWQADYIDKVEVTIMVYDSLGNFISGKVIPVRYANVVMPTKYVFLADGYESHILGRRKTKRMGNGEFDVICTYLQGSRIRMTASYLVNGEIIEREFYLTRTGSTIISDAAWAETETKAMWVAKYSWERVHEMIVTYDPEVEIQDLRLLKIELLDGNGDVKDVRIVQRERVAPYANLRMAFIGCMGQLEIVSLQGQDEVEADMGGTFLHSSSEYRKVQSDFTLTHKSKTGYLSKYEKATFHDLAVAPKAWLIKDGVIVPITITGIDYVDKKPSNEAVGFTVEWRFKEDNKQNEFLVE